MLRTIINYGLHPKDGGRYCFQFVSPHPGGVPGPGRGREGGEGGAQVQVGGSQVQVGGVPGQDQGGSQVQVKLGGYPVSGPGGIPSLSKGKNF